jgi:hypothetical protein
MLKNELVRVWVEVPEVGGESPPTRESSPTC